jgi:hypothetical protein
MPVMISADVGAAGGEHPGHPNGSINPVPSVGDASPDEVLIDSIPDQVGGGPASGRRKLSQRLQLVFRQLDLCADHHLLPLHHDNSFANMLV